MGLGNCLKSGDFIRYRYLLEIRFIKDFTGGRSVKKSWEKRYNLVNCRRFFKLGLYNSIVVSIISEKIDAGIMENGSAHMATVLNYFDLFPNKSPTFSKGW